MRACRARGGSSAVSHFRPQDIDTSMLMLEERTEVRAPCPILDERVGAGDAGSAAEFLLYQFLPTFSSSSSS